MSKSEKLDAIMKREAVVNYSKMTNTLTNDVTLKAYRNHIDKFCDFAKELGISRYHHIEMKGYSNVSLVQKYCDKLVAQGLAPTSVHTYLAPVCKGLLVGMEQINKPGRHSADIKKNTKLRENRRSEAAAAVDKNSRIIKAAELTGLRKHALVRLTAANLIKDENGDTVVAIIDKGGKMSCQLILPHEEKALRKLLTTDKDGKALAPGEKPFSRKDLGEIAFSRYRIQRAQAIEQYFSNRFNAWKNMPRRTPAQIMRRMEAKKAAIKEKKMWIDKIVEKCRVAHPKADKEAVEKFRKDLENPAPICIRGGNRERAKELGRPLSYDRVSVKIASVYALSHWSDESTLRNYLTK